MVSLQISSLSRFHKIWQILCGVSLSQQKSKYQHGLCWLSDLVALHSWMTMNDPMFKPILLFSTSSKGGTPIDTCVLLWFFHHDAQDTPTKFGHWNCLMARWFHVHKIHRFPILFAPLSEKQMVPFFFAYTLFPWLVRWNLQDECSTLPQWTW